MSEITEERPVVDEEQLYHEAALGSNWWGARIAIALSLTLFGGIAFAYFYLRSLNSHGLCDPHGQTASTLMGSMILALILLSAIVSGYGNLKLKKGLTLDWQVANIFSLLAGVFAAGFQIWELTRINFYPGAFGYAGVYVAFAPVYSGVILLGMYWLETLIARSFRSNAALASDGGLGLSRSMKAENFRSANEGFSYFWNFMAFASIVFFVMFYVL